ncbi:MAG: hypothetical protein S4CHLAM2_17180 [Chlamydiales bacterium]|nr:hypothetical protein [Chlamydiales bacterium]
MISEVSPLMGEASSLLRLGMGVRKIIRKVDDYASKASCALLILAGLGLLLGSAYVYLLSERTITVSKESTFLACLGLGCLCSYGGVTQLRFIRTLSTKLQQELETNRRLSAHQSQQAQHMAQARANLEDANGRDREALGALVAQALASSEEHGDAAAPRAVPRSGYLTALTADALASASDQQIASTSEPMNVNGNEAGDDAPPTSVHLAGLCEQALATDGKSGSVSDTDHTNNGGSATTPSSPPVTADLNDLIREATD